MSRGQWMLTGLAVAVIALTVLVLVFRNPPPDVADTAPQPTDAPVTQPPVVNGAPVTPDTVGEQPVAMPIDTSVETETAREYDDVATAEEGLRSMGTSLSQGDARTPELSEDVQREKPTPDVLNDPAAYEAFEQSQSRRIAAGYLSIVNQVPAMRARIEEAKISGQMTPEEIAEAEEVVEKILELEREMAAKDPDLINEVRKAGQAPAPEQ